jgi:hypothetical protein
MVGLMEKLRPKKKYSTLAVLSFILAFLIYLPYWGILIIILALVALYQINKSKHLKGRWLAIAAIVMGVAQVFLTIYVLYINKS